MRRPSAPSIVTFGAVGGVIAVVLWQLHPSLLLTNTTITGGDTGAHVGLAGFLKSNLLPRGHFTGWDPGAYDGFPLNTFYFPLPDFLAAAAGYVIPFNIAFKLVTVLGSVTLPIAAWIFGRLAGLERPRPAVLAIATLPFLFDQSFTIYGGNLYSTMAGEYAFSLGLSFALVFLGLVIRGLKTGRLRAVTAVILVVCILCHLITALFAVVGAVVILLLMGPTKKRLWWMVSSVGCGLLVVSWWAVPFVLDQAYATNMGWLNVTTYVQLLLPVGDLWAVILAAMGAVLAVVVAITRRQPAPLVLVVLGVGGLLAVRFDPQDQLYNVRFLPLYFICVYLLAGFFVAEALVAVARGVRLLRLALWRDSVRTAAATVAPAPVPAMAMAGVGTVPLVGLPVDPPPVPDPPPPPDPADRGGRGGQTDPGGPTGPGGGGPGPTSWPRPRFGPWAPGAITVPIVCMMAALAVVLPPLVPWMDTDVGKLVHHSFAQSSVAGWAEWNYSGYERTPGWNELKGGVIDTLEGVAKKDGCGRTMWEYNANENRFGTPEALMNLPYWTDNCIGSIEGVLFESSATTPYHFVNQAELSVAPSEAVVTATTGLKYGSLDVSLGVQHLQLLGIKYFLAASTEVQSQAAADPALKLVASSGPWRTDYQGQELSTTWKVYEVKDAAIVRPLTKTPDVLTKTGESQAKWLPVAQAWYADPTKWSQQLVEGGPAGWRRTATPGTAPAGKALPAVKVSRVKVGTDSVNFHVDRTGVPVEVAVSYFPNWKASGASGPWRAEPNLMVVDPTSKDVTLTYGASRADHLGLVLSVIGLAVLVVLIRRRRFIAGWSALGARARHGRH